MHRADAQPALEVRRRVESGAQRQQVAALGFTQVRQGEMRGQDAPHLAVGAKLAVERVDDRIDIGNQYVPLQLGGVPMVSRSEPDPPEHGATPRGREAELVN